MQVYLRPKIFLLGSSLAFSLKEDPVRCAKVCDKSWVILQQVEYISTLKSLIVEYACLDFLASGPFWQSMVFFFK